MKDRIIGINHIYLDEKLDEFSNFAVGLVLRAIGHGLKIAYVDVLGKSNKFSNFMENISLNKTFVKDLNKIYMEMYSFKNYNLLSKSIIPLVEFNSINREIFLKSLKKYDLIIFDNFNLQNISKQEVENILNNKTQTTEIIFICENIFDFNQIKNKMDIITKYEYSKNNSLISNNNITNIFGDGRGKSIYSFGYIIRNFINKKNIKLIHFDKADNINGETIFFKALKKWSKLNKLYGEFDFVITGNKRIYDNEFRNQSNNLDEKEAKEALMLLDTALKKQTPVIADELGSIITNNILNSDEVLNVLKSVKNELLITGNLEDKKISQISGNNINVFDEKKLTNIGFKRGIDY